MGTSVRRHKLRFVGLALVLGFIVFTGVGYASDPYQFNCYVVGWSHLQQIGPGVYVDPTMQPRKRVRFLQDIRLARRRVGRFFGALKDDPIIMAGPLNTVYRVYGSAAGTTGITHLTMVKDYTVLGPNGFNVDVISHELTHGELKVRLGWSNFGKVPVWFDEGMTMYNDDRPRYSEAAYQRLTDHGRTAPRLSAIASRVGFYDAATDQRVSDERVYINFIVAKHEFARWYKIVGRGGVDQLIKAVRAGESFTHAYKEIEDGGTLAR